jgi:copper(I)-binding protein
VSRKPLVRPTGAAAVAAAVIGAITLAGCGAGQIAQTAGQVAAVGGASADAGQIAVRDVSIAFPEDAEGAAVYPAGGQAPLQMSIVNFGSGPDRLLSASSPAAASVGISGETGIEAGQALVVEGELPPAPATPTAPALAPSGTAAPGAPGATTAPAAPTPIAGLPTPTIAPTGEPNPRADQQTEVPPPSAGGFDPAGPGQGTVEDPSAVDEGTRIVLTGLREEVQAGLTYPLVLQFERAGEVRVQVPVANSTATREAEPGE